MVDTFSRYLEILLLIKKKVNAVLLFVCQLLYELLPGFLDLKPVSHFHLDVFSKLLSLLILQM